MISKDYAKLREEAVNLRVEKRLSLKDIQKTVNVSISTLSLWLREFPRTQEEKTNFVIPPRKAAIMRGKKKNNSLIEEKRQSEVFWNEHKHETLFVLGIGLYWGEGQKSVRSAASLTMVNTDACLLKVWLLWCKTYIQNPCFRFKIQAHPDVFENVVKEYWKNIFGISENDGLRFYYVVPVSSKRKRAITNPLSYGTMTITLRKGNAMWARRMMHFLELIKQDHELSGDRFPLQTGFG